jgi:hypothetical protein
MNRSTCVGRDQTDRRLRTKLVVNGPHLRRRRQCAWGLGRSRVRRSLGGEPSGPRRCYTARESPAPRPGRGPSYVGRGIDADHTGAARRTLCSVRGSLFLVGGRFCVGREEPLFLIGTSGHCWPHRGWRMPSWASRHVLSARCQVPRAECWVPGAEYRDRCTRGWAPDARHEVPGAECQVPGAKHEAPSASSGAPSAEHRVAGDGPPGAKNEVHGAGCGVPGTWRRALGTKLDPGAGHPQRGMQC